MGSPTRSRDLTDCRQSHASSSPQKKRQSHSTGSLRMAVTALPPKKLGAPSILPSLTGTQQTVCASLGTKSSAKNRAEAAGASLWGMPPVSPALDLSQHLIY